MTAELNWGLPVISYLFLAGVGAGALTVSASIFLRGGSNTHGMHVTVARYGAFVAPLPVIVGCGLLVLELGTFQAGHWFRWINLYRTINLSPMSIGTWLLTAFIGFSLVYAYSFMQNAPGISTESRYRLRKVLCWLAVPLGIATAVYTGILLGAMPARPFWNTPILAMLFLISSLSTGIAAILLARAVHGKVVTDAEEQQHHHYSGYLLTASDVLLIGFELLVIFLFIMYAHLTIGAVKESVDILFSGNIAALFWLGVVVVGLLLPALVELKYVIPKLLYQQEFKVSRGVEIAMPVVVLVGGFLLRYVVVVAGQLTGPVGI